MLHVNPKVRGLHPRLLERCAGSPPLSSRWSSSSTNVEITDCQLGLSSVSSSLASWGSVVAFATTESANATSEWTEGERAH
eukprot:2566055-Prymnesium_polylepis.2